VGCGHMSVRKPENILILEDDAGVARVQQKILERAGYRVQAVTTCAEARSHLEAGDIDLLLLDNRLANGMEGLAFYRELRSAGFDVPVVLITGFSNDATVIAAFRAGVRDYVTKSLEYLNYLPEVVQRVLNQVQIEHRLAESQARLSGVIHSALDAIIALDEQKNISLFNPAAEQMFHMAAADAIGSPVTRFLSDGPLSESTAGPAAAVLAGATPMVPREMRARRADGSQFPVELSLAREDVGGRRQFTLILRDVTARKRAETDLRESNQQLQKALADVQEKTEELRSTTQQLWQAAKLASVGELAASIAHELNNPLGIVSLRLESVLEQTPAGDPRRRPLEIIEQELERMTGLIANVLQFSRRGKEEASSVDVCAEIRRVLELTHHHLRKRNIEVQLEFAPNLPIVYADRQKLRQLFLNLITNAGDAMPHGGRLTPRVHRGEFPDGRRALIIEIADTGVGIPPELLPKVMDPFFTTKEEDKGTGLGLAICRRVVHEHSGSIELQSIVGNGTTVRILLPVDSSRNVSGFQ